MGVVIKVKITTSYRIGEKGEEVDRAVESTLFKGLKSHLPEGTSNEMFTDQNLMSSQKVDPTISDEIRRSSILATILSLTVIFLYLLFRFRKYTYGAGAVVTLIHDVLILLAIFSIGNRLLPFSLEIDQAFIAALLTVIGYSLNDTVVVFDRIREYLGLYPKKSMKDVVNEAVSSTLSRTLITSVTTLIVVLLLFIFGGEVIRGFSFALLIGVIVGTYSSIFIATPVMYDLTKQKEVRTVSGSKGKNKSGGSKKSRK